VTGFGPGIDSHFSQLRTFMSPVADIQVSLIFRACRSQNREVFNVGKSPIAKPDKCDIFFWTVQENRLLSSAARAVQARGNC
jgi:hypothetical protein